MPERRPRHELMDVIREAIRDDKTLKPRQKAAALIALRNPFIAMAVCYRCSCKLAEDGVIRGDAIWDPESWDWDKVIERIKDLAAFIVELIFLFL